MQFCNEGVFFALVDLFVQDCFQKLSFERVVCIFAIFL